MLDNRTYFPHPMATLSTAEAQPRRLFAGIADLVGGADKVQKEYEHFIGQNQALAAAQREVFGEVNRFYNAVVVNAHGTREQELQTLATLPVDTLINTLMAYVQHTAGWNRGEWFPDVVRDIGTELGPSKGTDFYVRLENYIKGHDESLALSDEARAGILGYVSSQIAYASIK